MRIPYRSIVLALIKGAVVLTLLPLFIVFAVVAALFMPKVDWSRVWSSFISERIEGLWSRIFGPPVVRVATKRRRRP